MKYRVKTEINTVTNQERFIVQYRCAYFFWLDFSKRKGLVLVRAVFKSKKKAKKHIDNYTKCTAWVKTK